MEGLIGGKLTLYAIHGLIDKIIIPMKKFQIRQRTILVVSVFFLFAMVAQLLGGYGLATFLFSLLTIPVAIEMTRSRPGLRPLLAFIFAYIVMQLDPNLLSEFTGATEALKGEGFWYYAGSVAHYGTSIFSVVAVMMMAEPDLKLEKEETTEE